MLTSVAEAVLEPRQISGVVRVETIDDVTRFGTFRSAWQELLSASTSDNPFLTWEWLYSWWEHLRGNAALQLACIYAGNVLIGIAPLMLVRPPFRFPSLEFLGTGNAGSDYLDIIVREGCAVEAQQALTDTLEKQRRSTRFAHVANGAQTSAVADRLSRIGWGVSRAASGTCPVVPLADHTWDSYLATVGSAHRANVRRRLRALEHRFETRFTPVTTDDERRDALASLFAFHESRFRLNGGSTAFSSPALRAFHDAASQRALQRGWLRMYLLRLNETIAAVMYGFGYNRQFYFYQHGFDGHLQGYSIGLALMALTIRAAIAEGMTTFDMLWGAESYKSLWTRDARALYRIDVFPPGLRGRMHHHAWNARRRAVPLLRRILTSGDHRAV